MIVRSEQVEDHMAVRAVLEAAFARPAEAELVERLRLERAIVVERVAELVGAVVGHIVFSRMQIETATEAVAAVALAPLAVMPAHQGRGVGGQLIRDGLEALRDRGEQIVIVLGHPAYYPRFGFSAERTSALEGPFRRSDSFMALELEPGALDGVRGRVRYAAAFGL